MNDNSNIVALILQFQEEEGGISRVLQRVTRYDLREFCIAIPPRFFSTPQIETFTS